MFAGLQRGPGQFEVRVRRGADVDHIEIAARHDRLPVGGMLADPELGREGTRTLGERIADQHDLAARVAQPARDMRVMRPAPCAKDGHPQPLSHASLPPLVYVLLTQAR